MKQPSPFFSALGFIFVAIILLVLAAMYWKIGNGIFSPGPLTAPESPGQTLEGFASHAEFENQCERCHQPFSATQDQLCTACHTNIGRELADPAGLHGKMADARQCRLCHSDHRGRDFDPMAAALAAFDHRLTNFSLIWHQVGYNAAPLDCRGCHTALPHDFSVTNTSCAACHGAHDQDFLNAHAQTFGPDCLACHDGVDRMVNFDHTSTGFNLLGKHAEARCSDCHSSADFQAVSPDCASCHAEPVVHLGLFGTDCAACHLPAGWAPAALNGQPFSHDTDTRFSLAFHKQNLDGQPINCVACHLSADGLTPNSGIPFAVDACAACHSANDSAFMAEHLQRFGPGCLDCHDGSGGFLNFDHSQVFLLEGRHAQLECASCHIDNQFRGTPNQCFECHQEPAIHLGFFGLECGNCHTTTAWSPASLKNHVFPLDHGRQGQIACATCHVSRYTEYTCYGCHEHPPGNIAEKHQKEGISAAELPNCARCHPTGLKKGG